MKSELALTIKKGALLWTMTMSDVPKGSDELTVLAGVPKVRFGADGSVVSKTSLVV